MENKTGSFELVLELESMESDVKSLPMVFAEMLKDEINAVDEIRLYNGIKRIIKKYSEYGSSAKILDEFTSVLTGGTTLHEVLQIVKEEVLNPSAASDLNVGEHRLQH